MTRASRERQVDVISKFLESKDGRTLLMERDAGGWNAMTKAASEGQVTVIRKFLESKDGRTLLTEPDAGGRNAMTMAAYEGQVAVIIEFLKSKDGLKLLYMSRREALNESRTLRILVGIIIGTSVSLFGLILLHITPPIIKHLVKIIKHLVNRLDDLYNRLKLTRLATRTLRTATENALDANKTSVVKKGLFDFYILKRRIHGEPVGPRLQIVDIPNLNEREQQDIRDIYAHCLTYEGFIDSCFISHQELNDVRKIGLHGNAFVGLDDLGKWIAADNHSEKISPPGLKEGLVFGPDPLLIDAQEQIRALP